MRESIRSLKENSIIDAAEKIFNSVGFRNAKMEDISSEAGITKVTLYSYFQSKENLYLAITYRAIQQLNDRYYSTLDEYKSKPGIESVLALIETFMTFCEENFLYSEALLDYFALVRSTSSGRDTSKLTDATKESINYMKIQDVQNIAFKLTASEIKRGQEDGSINKELDPMFATLHGWTFIIGYIKVLSANGSNKSPLFNVSLSDLKSLNLRISRSLLSNNEVKEELNYAEY